MSEGVQISDGDFVAVVNRYGRIEVRQVIKTSPAFFFYQEMRWAGEMVERRVRRDDVVFVGPRQIAEKLAAQLTSSQAQADEDKRRAVARRIERDKKFIEQANAAKDHPT